MNPIAHSVQTVVQVHSKFPSPSTSRRSLGALLTTSIQQATSSPSSSATIQMDTVRPAMVSPAMVLPAMVSETSSSTFKRGMTSGTKIGLSMIPVISGICAMWILFLFWWRRRRARKAIRYVGSPYVPEKEPSLFNESIDSGRKGSKVFRMAAFSTPVHDGRFREARVLDHRKWDDQTAMVNQLQNNELNAPMVRLTDPAMIESGLDSPIDRSSPFRLKRGDTVKRCSLGTEISSLWPSPPLPSAWVKRTTIPERVFTTPYPGEDRPRDHNRPGVTPSKSEVRRQTEVSRKGGI